VDISRCTSSDGRILPDKTLFNMGMDASPTTNVVLASVGVSFALDSAAESSLQVASEINEELIANDRTGIVILLKRSNKPIEIDSAGIDCVNIEYSAKVGSANSKLFSKYNLFCIRLNLKNFRRCIQLRSICLHRCMVFEL
jgi:hypothetical protein